MENRLNDLIGQLGEAHYQVVLSSLARLALDHNYAIFRHQSEVNIKYFWSKRSICVYIVNDLKLSILAKQLINIGNNIAKILHQPYYPFFEPFHMQFLYEVTTNQDTAWLKSQFAQIENYYYPSIYAGKFIRFTININLESP
ncbi:hypothetical protein, partial [Gilliamella mensalis]|uniref:hypothetical protein n=1 Tax=Gilliamella mensalis TaxID=1908520 RepID=UPI00117A9693